MPAASLHFTDRLPKNYAIMGCVNVAFLTFGCRLNRAEALDQEARLLAEGHTLVALDKGPSPDVIVVRGCSVTAKAERDCRKAIARLHARFPSARIEITGCLKSPPISSSLTFNSQLPTLNSPSVPLRTARAYLKIQDGCSGKCAFCIVPSFRGKPRSVPFGEILARAHAFLSAGYRELVVTGCNLALYSDSGHGLPDVLAALASMGTGPRPSHRVRLSSLEPGVCDNEVLDAFAAHPNICRFIHLSVQSGSDHILTRMNRPYSIETVDRFCSEAVRRLGARLALGADIITGFPGETESDFAATRDFLLRHPFVNLHVFPYSERPGTAAATMDGAVPLALRRTRARELERIGQTQRRAFAAAFLGQEVEVCIEHDKTGWTAEYLKCALNDLKEHGNRILRRHLVRGRVVRVDGESLVAEPSVPAARDFSQIPH
jgi:threonylcarbamoyladenosine tRNA methylthiotransferase MtaB